MNSPCLQTWVKDKNISLNQGKFDDILSDISRSKYLIKRMISSFTKEFSIQREVRGLNHARKKVADHADTDCLILTETISPHVRIPEGVNVKILRDWLIGEEDV